MIAAGTLFDTYPHMISDSTRDESLIFSRTYRRRAATLLVNTGGKCQPEYAQERLFGWLFFATDRSHGKWMVVLSTIMINFLMESIAIMVNVYRWMASFKLFLKDTMTSLGDWTTIRK